MKIHEDLWEDLETVRTEGEAKRVLGRSWVNTTPERRGWIIRAFSGMYTASMLGNHRTVLRLPRDTTVACELGYWLWEYLEYNYGLSCNVLHPVYGGSGQLELYRLRINIRPQESE